MVSWLATSILVAVVAVVGVPLYHAWSTARTPDHETENTFKTEMGTRVAFPRVFEPASLYMSLIVPAYNEELRLPGMLDEMIAYLSERQHADRSFTWEIIVVDDGSSDQTATVAMSYTSKYSSDRVRLLKLYQNNGKGGAVRKGMMRARGQYLLMVDADGATMASELETVEKRLKAIERNGLGVAVGSRAHLQQQAVATRKWYRNILMHGFHALVYTLCGGHGVQDTQCGFKMFTRLSATMLFPSQHIDRWAFDVELLFLAARLDIPITEVSVRWTEIEGSKLNVVTSSIQMLRDLVLIRLCYTLRIWQVAEWVR